ncbi:hypothetical protein NEMBOFW57_009680 [Staphylotrichum longicolle]|uniref:Uncharacterized protein n=1 Tax=Staphylotrichum longicolle TaxID=669026 RepID=A0AAD4HW61_9PEZI|nr:hypothetical protein NEMBOFW57_009680 [Staphylotrichum longicolle]
MGARACWERQITSGYEHFAPTEPPTWKRGKITQYFYNPTETAIHMAGPVDLFEPPPEKQVSDRDLLFGHQPTQMKPQPSHMKPQLSEIGPVGPLSVWEPHLDGGQIGSDTLAKIKSICKRFDVVACTHIDLENVFQDSEENKGGLRQSLLESIRSKKGRSKSSIESHARRLLMSGVGRRNEGRGVARSGKLGCLVATRVPGNRNKVRFDWLPSSYDDIFLYMAYMEIPNSQDYKVVHIGTLFVGALTYAMAKGASAVEAEKQAAVASTCLMQLEKHRFEFWPEHINIPAAEWELISTTRSVTAHDLQPFHRDGKDYWLGTDFENRLKLFQTTPSDPNNPRYLFSRLARLPKTLPPAANARAKSSEIR